MKLVFLIGVTACSLSIANASGDWSAYPTCAPDGTPSGTGGNPSYYQVKAPTGEAPKGTHLYVPAESEQAAIDKVQAAIQRTQDRKSKK